MGTNLIPISSKEFRKVAKGCGIRYRNKILSRELKAMLGYCPLDKRRRVEVSDKTGFCRVYDSIKEAAKDCQISNSSAIKYVMDYQRSS